MVAKYQQLALTLEQAIADGALVAGSQLPTEQALSAQYGMARGTVRKALELLERKGFIYTEQGSGSFVRQPWVDALPFQFSEPVDNGVVTYKTLTQEVIPVPLELAAQLNILPTTPVIHLAQHKRVDRVIVSYIERYLPQSLCPALINADLTKVSVHDILLHYAELPPVRATINIETTLLTAADAALLHIDAGNPCIIVHRLSYTNPTRPAVWYRGLFRQNYSMGIDLIAQ